MIDLASRVGTRAGRLDRAVVGVQARFAALLPGGEVQDIGHAIWTMTSTPILVANGVVRYDATDFQGPRSELELDNCLTALSSYDVPWRFSAWDHLGGATLVPRLQARGMLDAGSDDALWLDLPGALRSRPTRSVGQSLDRGLGQSFDRSLGQSVDRSLGQSVDRSLGQSLGHGPDQSAGQGLGHGELHVRAATEVCERQSWARVFVEVFGIPQDYSDVFERIAAKPHARSLVGYVDGQPVGCLSMAIEEGLSVVYNVGVLPCARRRGVARHMMLAAHEASCARGARACVVVVSRAGADVCLRLGYHPVTRVNYLLPPSAAN